MPQRSRAPAYSTPHPTPQEDGLCTLYPCKSQAAAVACAQAGLLQRMAHASYGSLALFTSRCGVPHCTQVHMSPRTLADIIESMSVQTFSVDEVAQMISGSEPTKARVRVRVCCLHVLVRVVTQAASPQRHACACACMCVRVFA